MKGERKVISLLQNRKLPVECSNYRVDCAGLKTKEFVLNGDRTAKTEDYYFNTNVNECAEPQSTICSLLKAQSVTNVCIKIYLLYI